MEVFTVWPAEIRKHPENTNLDQGNSPQPVEPWPEWCICGFCREMERPVMNVCCRNEDRNHEHKDFEELILSERNLTMTMVYIGDLMHQPLDPRKNKCWRLVAGKLISTKVILRK